MSKKYGIMLCVAVLLLVVIGVSRYVQQVKAVGSMLDRPQLRLVHLGTDYGGWTIPEESLSAQSICYCVGAGEDISLDIELANKYGCKVYTFDPTPRAVEHFEKVKKAVADGSSVFSIPDHYKYQLSGYLAELLKFYPYGLWDRDGNVSFFAPQDPSHVSYSGVNLQATNQSFQATCKKLSSLMKMCGHARIDLLKMDIEGGEYCVLRNMLEEKIYPKVLCIEFHACSGEDQLRTTASLESAGYKLACINKRTDYTFVHAGS